MEKKNVSQIIVSPRPRQSPAGSPHRRHGLRLPFLEGWLDELGEGELDFGEIWGGEISENERFCVYIYIYMYGKHGVAFLLGNFCLVLGIKLMEMNSNLFSRYISLYIYIYVYIYIVGKEKTKKLFRLKVEGCFFRFRRGFLFFKNWNPSRIEKKTDTETFQAVLYGSYGPPTKPSRAFTKG